MTQNMRAKVANLERGRARGPGVELDAWHALRDFARARWGFLDRRHVYCQELDNEQAAAALELLTTGKVADRNAAGWLAEPGLPPICPAWNTVAVRELRAMLAAAGEQALAAMPEPLQREYRLQADIMAWRREVGPWPGSPVRLGPDGPVGVRCDANGCRPDDGAFCESVAIARAIWARRKDAILAGHFGREYVKQWG